MIIHNFTELYNLLKNNDSIVKSAPQLRNFVLTVENYRDTCSCDRKSEKNRLKSECDSMYRNIVTSIISNNLPIFKEILKENKMTFLYNGGILSEFTL
jgi:hypothetical protein